MFLKTLGLLTFLGQAEMAFAAPSPGPLSAQTLVSEVTAKLSAQAETKVKATEPENLTIGSHSSPPDLPLPEISSRVELLAGSDHIIGMSNKFFRQSSLFGEIRYSLNEWLQVGASGAIRIQGDGYETTDSAAQLLFGPTFNIGAGPGIQNMFFLSPKIGPTLAQTVINGTSVGNHTNLAFGITAGKRFAIGKTIALVSAMGSVWQKGNTPMLTVEPLAFSISF